MADGSKNKGAEIVDCTCKDEEQDKLHGKNKRVANLSSKGKRCTTCGKEHK